MTHPGPDVRDELERLVGVTPDPLAAALRALPPEQLLEVVMDLGRPAEARLLDRGVELAPGPVTRVDLDHVLARVGAVGDDNRAGIERTLHRISAIRNRKGDVVGLTLRVGRAVYGTIDIVRDLIESGKNLLLLGRPGVGKTTKLRELARVLADDLGKRVVVVDTSNEIGGDGDVPHPGIGRARRMQVPRPDRQHAVMIEAVENHMPEAIIVDEIGTQAEAAAARTIAERGVQLVGTAHGITLENLVLNPTLSDLVGGTHVVTLSDDEARRRGTTKTITERRAPPTFDVVVQLVGRDEVLVHHDTAQAVDRLLAGQPTGGDQRRLVDGRVETVAPVQDVAPTARPVAPARFSLASVGAGTTVRLHLHALSRDLLERVLRDLPLDVRRVDSPEHAEVILALAARAGDPRIRRASVHGTPVYTVKRNSTAELRRVLRKAFPVAAAAAGVDDEDDIREAVLEAEHAIARAMNEGADVVLAPRPPHLRKVQHRLIARYPLEATSVGQEPLRHLVVRPAESPPADDGDDEHDDGGDPHGALGHERQGAPIA